MDTYICPHCEKQLKNKSGLAGHVQRSHTEKEKQSKYGRAGNDRLHERVAAGLTTLGRPHTEETKQKLSVIACERLAKHSKYSKNTEYKPGVILESSFEVRTAEILDELNIEWVKVRRGYVWDDNGRVRRYIPDFYLPHVDLFLDPKNDYLIKRDKRKIDSAMALNNIKVIVLPNELINKEFIELLVL